MKAISTQQLLSGPVNGTDKVTFAISQEEMAEFIKAHAVITKIQKAALKELNRSKDYADWTMFHYGCTSKHGENTLWVEVEQGACG